MIKDSLPFKKIKESNGRMNILYAKLKLAASELGSLDFELARYHVKSIMHEVEYFEDLAMEIAERVPAKLVCVKNRGQLKLYWIAVIGVVFGLVLVTIRNFRPEKKKKW